MAKVCFLDNDIIRKLIAFGLFEEAIAILQITKAELRVLPNAKFFFRNKQKKSVQHTAKVWAEVGALVLKIVQLFQKQLMILCRQEQRKKVN